MVLIDANYIIRLLSKEPNEHFKKSKELFEKIAKREIKGVLSEGVLMECFFVLVKFYKYPKSEVCKFLSDILNLSNIIYPNKQEALKTLEILKNKNIDFIDALLCAKAKINNFQVATFDKDIIKCINS